MPTTSNDTESGGDDKSDKEEQQPSKAEQLSRDLQNLTRRARSLSRNSRKRIGQANNIRFPDTETSASSVSSRNSDNSESPATSRRTSRRSQKNRKKKKGYSMSRLLREQQGVLQNVVNKVTSPEKDEDIGIRTASNSFSKLAISEALKNERALNHCTPYVNGQVAKAPKLDQNNEASAKNNRDAMNTLKDMTPNRINGEEIEGIHEYLSLCSRVATNHKLSYDQFYDLTKSRITPNSTLYREITNNHKGRIPLKGMFKQLCTTYPGGSSYMSSLRRFDEFTGAGMSASKFISQLKNLAHDITHASKKTSDIEEAIFRRVYDKTLALLQPNISQDLYERYRTDMRGSDKDDLTVFTGSFMCFSDKIEQLLHHKQRNRSIKCIQESNSQEEQKSSTPKRNHGKRETRKDDSYSESSDDDNQNSELQVVNLLKLSKANLDQLQGACFKCGSKSPVQKPDHYSRECLLYSNEPLAMYMCGLCNLGVHLPSLCKQSAQGKTALEDKAKVLGVPLTTKTENGQVFAIIQLEKN